MKEEYLNCHQLKIRQGEPAKREKAGYWQTAIGLQAVDGLKVSDYLQDTARRHIEGDITIDEAREQIKSYYLERFFRNLLLGEKWDLRNRYLHIHPTKEWSEQPNQAVLSSDSRVATSTAKVATFKKKVSAEEMTIMILEFFPHGVLWTR